ncbi:hypothetical protein NKI41_32330 [Mesorhizobium sp. M0601]|uniref:hypothetical protein n=1 Tax=Mesorhizobium sp. M0601 TaxID=2956969 RepID=UPI003338F444
MPPTNIIHHSISQFSRHDIDGKLYPSQGFPIRQLFPSISGETAIIFRIKNNDKTSVATLNWRTTRKSFSQRSANAWAATTSRRPPLPKVPDRLQNRDALPEILDECFSSNTTGHWLSVLAGFVPAARIRNMDEALSSKFALNGAR